MTRATQHETLGNCDFILPKIKHVVVFFLPELDWAPGQASGAVAAPEETEPKLPGPQREQAPAVTIKSQSQFKY